MGGEKINLFHSASLPVLERTAEESRIKAAVLNVRAHLSDWGGAHRSLIKKSHLQIQRFTDTAVLPRLFSVCVRAYACVFECQQRDSNTQQITHVNYTLNLLLEEIVAYPH